MIHFPETRLASSDDAAHEAATRSGVVTRDLSGVDELRQLDGLMRAVWGGTQVALPIELLQTLVHSGNYVAGAWRGASLSGAAVAFLADRRGAIELHSHLVAVTRADQGSGVGLALKLHQRAWALSRGITDITWTYDPLMRRNAWFNLAKLHAEATAYYPNFHGVLLDEINGSDESDRVLVRWRLDQPFSLSAPPRTPPADSSVALISSATHSPIVHDRPMDGRRLMCQIPEDVLNRRRRDPGLAREWRMALRHTMGRAIASGYSATSMTKDGWYLLERESVD